MLAIPKKAKGFKLQALVFLRLKTTDEVSEVVKTKQGHQIKLKEGAIIDILDNGEIKTDSPRIIKLIIGLFEDMLDGRGSWKL